MGGLQSRRRGCWDLGKGKWLTTGILSQRPRAQLVRTKVKSGNKAGKRGCSHNVLG